MQYGHWDFDSEFNVEDWFGFIYRIIEKNTGKEYIGKKQFHSKRRKKVKDRKNRKVVLKESDWKKYISSSEYLQARILEFGLDNYIFIIESLQPSKGALSYAEIELQVVEDVLRARLPNGERKYYNKSIGNIKFIPPDAVTAQTRKKISGTNNPMFGKTGIDSPNFGRNPWDSISEEEQERLRKEASEKAIAQGWTKTGEEHHRFGKSCLDNMTEEQKQEWHEKVRLANVIAFKGKPKSEQAKQNMRKPKGPQQKITCTHCGTEGGLSNMKRMHLDNCSKNPNK